MTLIADPAEEASLDFYHTPDWAVERFLDALAPKIAPPRSILEPAAGDGALLGPLRARWPDATVDAYDIASKHPAVVNRPMWADDTPQRYDLVITNPPYTYGMEFIHYGLSRITPGGHLALLFRQTFIGSSERAAFWKAGWLFEKYTLSDRPAFRGGATDAVCSEWFVFDGKRHKYFRGYVI